MPPGIYPRPSQTVRFWKFVKKTDSCWIWAGNTSTHGYGKFKSDLRVEKVHRFAYRFLIGEIPEGADVLHKCGNRACVRPEHLYLGNDKENAEDRERMGRTARGERHGTKTKPERIIHGERHHFSRLSNLQRKAIWEEKRAGVKCDEIANHFGITKRHVFHMCQMFREGRNAFINEGD